MNVHPMPIYLAICTGQPCVVISSYSSNYSSIRPTENEDLLTYNKDVVSKAKDTNRMTTVQKKSHRHIASLLCNLNLKTWKEVKTKKCSGRKDVLWVTGVQAVYGSLVSDHLFSPLSQWVRPWSLSEFSSYTSACLHCCHSISALCYC